MVSITTFLTYVLAATTVFGLALPEDAPMPAKAPQDIPNCCTMPDPEANPLTPEIRQCSMRHGQGIDEVFTCGAYGTPSKWRGHVHYDYHADTKHFQYRMAPPLYSHRHRDRKFFGVYVSCHAENTDMIFSRGMICPLKDYVYHHTFHSTVQQKPCAMGQPFTMVEFTVPPGIKCGNA